MCPKINCDKNTVDGACLMGDIIAHYIKLQAYNVKCVVDFIRYTLVHCRSTFVYVTLLVVS